MENSKGPKGFRKPKLSPLQKARRYASRMQAKTIKVNAKHANRVAKLKEQAARGGFIGRRARNILTKISEGEARQQIAELKPKIYAQERKSTIESDAAVKKTTARGKAGAAIASALGASYSAGKVADKESAVAKAKAEAETAKALVDSLTSVPQVTSDPYSHGESVSGLVTGVR